jgi:hypothetical protein
MIQLNMEMARIENVVNSLRSIMNLVSRLDK